MRRPQNEAQADIEKLKVGLMPIEKLIEPILRQEEKPPPPNPELNPVEPAEQTRNRFFEEARESWLKETSNRYTQEAEDLTKQYWKLREEEPKEPLLFGKKDWEMRHGDWVDRVNGIAAEVKDKKQIAEVVKGGKFESDRYLGNGIGTKKPRSSLKRSIQSLPRF